MIHKQYTTFSSEPKKGVVRHSITDWFKVLLSVSLRETKYVFRSRIFVFLLFLLPLTFFPFFCYFYSQGLLSDIPVAVYDADNSELSRLLTRAIESSRSMKITSNLTNLNDLEQGIRSGKFKAAFYFPDNMEKYIKKQHQAFPVFYKNAQNIVISNSLYKETALIFKSYNAGILLKKIKLSGKTESQAMAIVQPVITDILYLYNANFSYPNFLSPAYIFVTCQMIVMLAGMFCITHEIEQKRYSRLIPGAFKYPGAMIWGKLLPILFFFNIIMIGVQFVLFPIFNIYIEGPNKTVFLFITLFLFSSLVSGFAIGTIFKNSFLATEVIIFVNMPSLLLSGYTFPTVPGLLAFFAKVLPFTHFMTLYFKIAQMASPLSTAFGEILILIIFSVVGFFVSWSGLIFLNKTVEKAGSF
jgi:ABC-2 type transport system permease protein